MKRMEYQELAPVTRDEAERVLERGAAEDLLYVVLSVSLHEPDGEWAEQYCLRLTDHDHPTVRGNAILALGHIARIHGRLDRGRAGHAIRKGLKDPDEYVRGQAHDARDDVSHFLGWKIE